MAFQKIQVFRAKDNKYAGYLSCSAFLGNVADQSALVTIRADQAYLYEWVSYSGGRFRLDQETSGANRSLTYDGDSPWKACWGLGANWIYLSRRPDDTVTYTDGGTTFILRMMPDRHLIWEDVNLPEGASYADLDGNLNGMSWNMSLRVEPQS